MAFSFGHGRIVRRGVACGVALCSVVAFAAAETARTVVWADGTYVLDAAKTWSAADGGTAEAPVTWKAEHPGKVIFSGARALVWRPCRDAETLARVPESARARVLEADWPLEGKVPSFQGGGEERVGEKSDDPVQLFGADGKRLPCARWPNGDVEALTGWTGTNGVREAQDGVFRTDAPRLAAWEREPELWACGQWQYQFHQMTVRVLKIDVAKGRVKVGYPEKSAFGIRAGMEWHAMNALCELDEPGEWVLSAKKRKLYCLPREGEAPPFLAGPEHLLALRGLEHAVFEGIVFEHARGDAVHLENAQDVTFRGCVFRHNGGWGVRGDAVRRVVVRSCDFHDLGKGGARLEGGDVERLVRGDNAVENCHVHHYGVLRPSYSPGVLIAGFGNSVRHCLMHDARHQGVLFQGGDHRVAQNVIHDVCTRNDDAGAIYCNGVKWLWCARGSVVEGNVVHQVGRKPVSSNCEGIYLDDFSSGITVRGNVVCQANRGVHVGGGNLNYVTNNLFVATRPAIMVGSRGVDSFAGSWVKAGRKSGFWKRFAARLADAKWRAHYPDCAKLAAITNEVALFDPICNVLRGNALVGSGKAMKNANVRVWPGMWEMADNAEYAAEDLPNLSAFDFRPRADSPLARKLADFHPEAAGLYADAWRTAANAPRFAPGATVPRWPPEGAYDPAVVRVDVSFAGALPPGEKRFADACVNAENPGGKRVSTAGYFRAPVRTGWREDRFSFVPRFDCEASLDLIGSYGDKTLYADVRVEGAAFAEDGWRVFTEGAHLGDEAQPYGVMTVEGKRVCCANHERWLVRKLDLKAGARVTVRFKSRALERVAK